jgi:hypothetical protein
VGVVVDADAEHARCLGDRRLLGHLVERIGDSARRGERCTGVGVKRRGGAEVADRGVFDGADVADTVRQESDELHGRVTPSGRALPGRRATADGAARVGQLGWNPRSTPATASSHRDVTYLGWV